MVGILHWHQRRRSARRGDQGQLARKMEQRLRRLRSRLDRGSELPVRCELQQELLLELLAEQQGIDDRRVRSRARNAANQVLFFPGCFGSECPAAPNVLAVETPTVAAVGSSVTVKVLSYPGAGGEPIPAPGATVSSEGIIQTTNASGLATLNFSHAGRYTLYVTGAGGGPPSVPGEAIVCVHADNDGTCGTAGPAGSSGSGSGGVLGYSAASYKGPYAVVAKTRRSHRQPPLREGSRAEGALRHGAGPHGGRLREPAAAPLLQGPLLRLQRGKRALRLGTLRAGRLLQGGHARELLLPAARSAGARALRPRCAGRRCRGQPHDARTGYIQDRVLCRVGAMLASDGASRHESGLLDARRGCAHDRRWARSRSAAAASARDPRRAPYS